MHSPTPDWYREVGFSSVILTIKLLGREFRNTLVSAPAPFPVIPQVSPDQSQSLTPTQSRCDGRENRLQYVRIVGDTQLVRDG